MLSNDVEFWLAATATSTPPTDDFGPFHLLSRGDGWSEATILQKFPGIAAAARLWAKPIAPAAGMSVPDAILGISHGA